MTDQLNLDHLFSFVREKGPVIVAVSGGSDSMAALYLTNAWAKKHDREVHAVTVDHGLRSEAAAEAAFVAMICDRLDIIHTTLAWDGIKPTSGISAAARNARYELIEEFASDIGVRLIITGHTLDDQAETILMRTRRTGGDKYSGNRGHAGICRRTLLSGGSLLLRPFLGVTRKKLRDYLMGISQSWVEDPSNQDELYERVRIRKELEQRPEWKTDLVQYSSVMGEWRKVNSQMAAHLLFSSCVLEAGHVFRFETSAFTKVPVQVSSLALKTVIACAGGGQYLVSDQKIEQVFLALESKSPKRLTMGNCIVEYKHRQLRIYREARNLRSVFVAANDRMIWDGRVRIINDSNDNIVIGPMSADHLEELKEADSAIVELAATSLLRSTPVVTLANGARIPVHFESGNLPGQLDVSTCASAIEHFCPEWDFPLLDWVRNVDIETGDRSHMHLFGSQC